MKANPKQRRRHSAAFKALVLATCAEPEASVAAVALSFKPNDNLVHQWRCSRVAGPRLDVALNGGCRVDAIVHCLVLIRCTAVGIPSVPIAAEVAVCKIRLELKRGAIDVSVTWPIPAAAKCAAWLREVLR